MRVVFLDLAYAMSCCHYPCRGNQLYIKHQEGDEDFEPVEAYFFDPTEYLEEETGVTAKPDIKIVESEYSGSCMTRHFWKQDEVQT